MAKTPVSALIGLPEYEQHPIAIKLMPGGMNPEEFAAFCEDVQERGIIFPVTLHEGKVLDGWHRYRAAHKTGTQFKTIEYNGKDPAGYVAACNVLRRKLSSLQRALVGARMHLEHAVRQSDVCRRLGISNTVLSMVLKVIDSRNTMLIKKIENDSDFTRGMLREELVDGGLVHENYGRAGAPKDEEDEPDFAPVQREESKLGANSVFALGSKTVEEDPLPEVGKRPSHKERRVRDTPAQRMQEHYKDLMHDEKATFLQMVWADMLPIAVELGLPGLAETKIATKAIAKAKRGVKV